MNVVISIGECNISDLIMDEEVEHGKERKSGSVS
jgi:hypothetical protein